MPTLVPLGPIYGPFVAYFIPASNILRLIRGSFYRGNLSQLENLWKLGEISTNGDVFSDALSKFSFSGENINKRERKCVNGVIFYTSRLLLRGN